MIFYMLSELELRTCCSELFAHACTSVECACSDALPMLHMAFQSAGYKFGDHSEPIEFVANLRARDRIVRAPKQGFGLLWLLCSVKLYRAVNPS
jgi:hypothetical protein